jgi:uncharacterized membrane protein YccC
MADGAALSGTTRRSLRSWLERAIPLRGAALSFAAGLRAATACAVPVLIAEVTGHNELSWIAIVAFWGCLADSGGAWRTRVAAMGGFTALAACGCLAALSAAGSIWLAVPLAFAWSFAASLARIFGNAAAGVGSLLVVLVIVCLGTPSASVTEMTERTAMTLVGGGWAMLLVLVIWRLYPYGPARRSIGECWQAVADYADALGHLHRGTAADHDWATVTRKRRAAARDAIEAAREVLAEGRRRRISESQRGALLLVLLAAVDQVFEALVGLSETLEGASGASRLAAQRPVRLMLHRIAQASAALGTNISKGRSPIAVPMSATLARVSRRLTQGRADAPESGGAYHHAADLLDRIVQYLAIAAQVADGVRPGDRITELTGRAEPEVDAVPRPPIWAVIRANLSLTSLHCRHALRIAVAAAISIWLADFFAIERGYWIGITAVVIVQPFLASTWQRAFERVIGSVLGGMIAAGLGLVLQSPMALVAVLFPLSVITMAVRGVNYTLFVLFLTPQFVTIAELFQTGGAPSLHLAELRGLDSVLGGVLGLAAGFLLWPNWEKVRLPHQLALALRAHSDYLSTARRGADSQALQAARRNAGLASNNAEASLQRLLGEPRLRPNIIAEPAMTIVVCLRRLAGAAAAISLAPSAARRTAQPDTRATLTWAAAVLGQLAEAVEYGTAVPDLPQPMPQPERGSGEIEPGRIGRQIEVLHAAARRLTRGEAAEPDRE